MAVTLRLSRAGAKKRPFYHLVATDSRDPRDGRFIERLGFYDPTRDPAVVQFKLERVDYWLGNGAQTSATVNKLINRFRKEQAAG